MWKEFRDFMLTAKRFTNGYSGMRRWAIHLSGKYSGLTIFRLENEQMVALVEREVGRCSGCCFARRGGATFSLRESPFLSRQITGSIPQCIHP